MQEPEFSWLNFLLRIDRWVWAILTFIGLNLFAGAFEYSVGIPSFYGQSISSQVPLWTPLRFFLLFGHGAMSDELYSSTSLLIWAAATAYLVAAIVISAFFGRGYPDALYSLGPLLLLSISGQVLLHYNLALYRATADHGILPFVHLLVSVVVSTMVAVWLSFLLEPMRDTMPTNFRAR